MRVDFDHQIFSLQQFGGISRYFVRLAEQFDAMDEIDCRIVAPLHVNAYLSGASLRHHTGVALQPGTYGKGLARHVNGLVSPLLIDLGAPDILHETYYGPAPRAKKKRSVVLTVYDMIHERFADQFAKDDPTAALKKAAVERADLILCISASTERDLLEFIPSAAGRTRVTMLAADQATPAAAGPRPTRRPYILHVGERARYKNFVSLLEAYANSDWIRAHFDLMCFGGGAFTGEENRRISELRLADGAVRQQSGTDAELADAYRHASLFVYPSIYEGFGIPPLEAMASGCPVICADTSSMPEVCLDAALYFDPRQKDSLEAQMERLLRSETLCESLVVRGRQRCTELSWRKTANETLEAYRMLA